jgi:FAD/FMN-containing dehydrogenase/Fe-S oxidoreductase
MAKPQIDWQKLATQIEGSVDTSFGARGAFATDASVYQQMPIAVACPKNKADLETLLGFCREQRIPTVGRGGGTSLSGQAIGSGLIVDFSRYMNSLIRVDPSSRTAVVEPGIVLDDLNALLARHGLLFAPDPATASRATIGGMIGNNACGTRSIVFGRTSDSIESLQCLLPDGNWLTTQWYEARAWDSLAGGTDFSSRLVSKLSAIIERYRASIEVKIPNLPRMAAGYSLQYFVDRNRPKSFSDLIVGGEGTLALAAEATLRLRPIPAATAIVVSSFSSVNDALCALPEILRHQPSAVELLDDILLSEAVRNTSTREMSRVIVTGGPVPAAVLLVEFFGETVLEAVDRAQKYLNSSSAAGCAGHHVLQNPEEQKQAWELRRLGLGLISNIPGKAKSIALIEDACIPIERLPEYNRFVYEFCEKIGMGISTYAHASVGVLHYKVMLDLHEQADRCKMREIAEACFEKCCEVGGVFSGEHGDGIVRGEFLRRQFGPQVYQAFVEVKQLFDPDNLFNPNRKIDAPPLDHLLRYGDSESDRVAYLQTTTQISSRFRYGEQGNLTGAIEQCNGVGACRKNLKGAMCPSYRATRDERDSTRGRANLLRLAISGQLDPPGLVNPDLHAALDLCLSCKACKSECPNAVDMARLKSEALQVKWEQQGASANAKFIAAMPQRLALAARMPWAARLAMGLPFAREILQKRYGIDRRRQLPRPAKVSFDQWWKQNRRKGPSFDRKIALFVDTWNRFLEPDIAIAVVELLWSCGYEVTITQAYDALRTRMSVGFLDEARTRSAILFSELATYANAGIPVLCIEPSEASALTDDLPDLIKDESLGRLVAANVHLIDDFLAEELGKGHFKLTKRTAEDTRAVIVHPHCHQRALFRAAATQELLAAAGYVTTLTDLGCCGMAGGFGYSHYDVSLKISEQKFLPAIRQAQQSKTLVVATGTSCREQAHDLASAQTYHWAQLIVGSDQR